MRRLYEDKKFKVYQADAPNEHDLYVDDVHLYLSRGILKECANTDTKGLKQKLEAVNWTFLNQIFEKEVSLEELGWAMSKARIAELEEEVIYFIGELNEARKV